MSRSRAVEAHDNELLLRSSARERAKRANALPKCDWRRLRVHRARLRRAEAVLADCYVRRALHAWRKRPSGVGAPIVCVHVRAPDGIRLGRRADRLLRGASAPLSQSSAQFVSSRHTWRAAGFTAGRLRPSSGCPPMGSTRTSLGPMPWAWRLGRCGRSPPVDDPSPDSRVFPVGMQ